MKLFWILALSTLAACSSTPEPKGVGPWSRITVPRPGPARSIGSASAGCLVGAASLPPDGPGFQVMRITRRRFYGHPSLISFIQNYGKTLNSRKVGPILVGDLGQPQGGPMLSGHRSHQTGLDVDLWFANPVELKNRSLTLDEREQLGAPSVTEKFPARFTENQVLYLELAAEFPEVDRIFVNPSIKKLLCERALSQTAKKASEPAYDWLRKIRPWWGHSDHFHVRLQCPLDSPECIPTAALDPGLGCDSTLEWWFTPEASAPAPAGQPKVEPALPLSCQAFAEF